MLKELINDNLLYCCLAAAFIIVTLVQLIYIWWVYGRFAFARKHSPLHELRPVSVVIAAKNEFMNLNRNLPLFLQQDYPDYEIVVVDDASDDDTGELLDELARKYERLKVVTIHENLNFFSGKKFPLALGIRSAKNDLLLLTDADCRPGSVKWIEEMQGMFIDEKTKIVLGYGAYERKKGLLNKIIRWETAVTAQKYFSLAFLGQPYMGVGRNLAYKKEFFLDRKGFISHYHHASGDDDIFVNQNATKGNVRIVAYKEAHTISEPKNTFSSWWRQKKRHLTTAVFYKFRHRFILGLEYLSQYAFYCLLVSLLIIDQRLIHVLVVAGIFLLREVSRLVVFKKSMNILSEKNLLLFSLIFELFFMVVYPLLMISNYFREPRRWN